MISRSIMVAGLIVLGLQATAEVRLSEPTETGPGFEVFGAPMADKSPGTALSALIEEAERHEGMPVRLTAEVSKVCQKKGCFFIAAQGDHWARITFDDYAFFVPTDSQGYQATLEGIFSMRQIPAAQVDHYARDLGEASPEVSGSQIEYGILATSVLLKSPTSNNAPAR